MPFVNADRVKETSTTTGTGTYDLAGAVAGFRTFVAGIGTTNLCNYVAENGTDWEVGIGTVTDATPDTLARTLVLASSNAGAAVNWGAGTKNIFCASIAADRNPRTRKLTAQHSISSTTGTAVTGLELANIQPGTYVFKYALIVQSATSTVGPMLGINFTGTGAPRMHFRFADATTVVTAEVHSMDNQGNKGFGFISGMASNAETTTAPDMGTTVGVAATATDILCFIEGVIIVTAVGNLELWHSSETATATSVEVGSSVILTRIDD